MGVGRIVRLSVNSQHIFMGSIFAIGTVDQLLLETPLLHISTHTLKVGQLCLLQLHAAFQMLHFILTYCADFVLESREKRETQVAWAIRSVNTWKCESSQFGSVDEWIRQDSLGGGWTTRGKLFYLNYYRAISDLICNIDHTTHVFMAKVLFKVLLLKCAMILPSFFIKTVRHFR